MDGAGAQVGGSVGEGFVVEGGAMFGDGYQGAYLGAGVGVGTPVGVSGYVTNTNTRAINAPETVRQIREFIESLGLISGPC